MIKYFTSVFRTLRFNRSSTSVIQHPKEAIHGAILLLIMFRDGWRLGPPKLMMLKYGVPKALISDQGSHFCNRNGCSTCEVWGSAQS
ncbi:hypothetical protein CR513_20708, partial [Mucuna pruriens]